MRRFYDWLDADDAWHSLAAVYLRLGRPDNAGEAPDSIEPGLVAFREELTQALAKPDDDAITVGQRQRQPAGWRSFHRNLPARSTDRDNDSSGIRH